MRALWQGDKKFALAAAVLLLSLVAPGAAQRPDGAIAYGPYNAVFLDVGTGLSKPLAANDVLLDPGAQWSIYGWVRVAKPMVGNTVIAVVGNPNFAGSRSLGTNDGKLALYAGRDAVVRSDVTLAPGSWHLVAATFADEEAHLYADGAEVGHGPVADVALAPLLNLAPTSLVHQRRPTLWRRVGRPYAHAPCTGSQRVIADVSKPARTSTWWSLKTVRSSGPCRPVARRG